MKITDVLTYAEKENQWEYFGGTLRKPVGGGLANTRYVTSRGGFPSDHPQECHCLLLRGVEDGTCGERVDTHRRATSICSVVLPS